MKGNKNGNYLVASVYYLAGNIIGQGIVLLSSTIFTRIMDKEAYGLVSTYSAWVLVLNTFIGLNLFITVRNAYIDYKEDYKKYTSSVMLFSLLAFVFFTGLIIGVISVFHFKIDIFIVFLASVQAISVHSVNYQMAVYSMENKYKLRTMLMVAPNILHTALSVILVLIYSNHQYYGKIIGNVLGIAVFAGGIVISLFRKVKPDISFRYWKYAAVISVPAILNTLSDLVLMQSDRIMLTELVGSGETAVYSLVYNIGSILIALYTAINGSWTPWFYMKLEQKDVSGIRHVQSLYIKGFTFLTIGLLTVSPEIIKILAPKSYWNGIRYVNLIMIASFIIFLYSFFTTYLMYLKKTGIIGMNTVFAAGLNLVLNYILIPEYHAVGAAVSTIISYIVLFLLHWIPARKFGKEFLCMRTMLKCLCLLLLYSILFYLIRDYWMIRYVIAAGMGFILLKKLLIMKKNGLSGF